ncbi:MAG: mandelate racemase/muconate lactonizing enzyme family protein [Acidobacteria bacterium]|nr:mandelate racemase/muconate lactonizing enzyme family protein [Acidobacteriota bacterium]
MDRRIFLTTPAALAATRSAPAAADDRRVPAWEQPVFQLQRQFKSPVKIAGIELLRAGRNFFVRATSSDGATGITLTKQIEEFIPILLRNVIPAYVGQDARNLEALSDEVYIRNYKMAGQPFWCPVAYVEQSLFDLLGKIAGKPAGQLMGGSVRKEIPVYLSGSGRETTAEEEVDVYVRGIAETGARAVKFKIGGRMSRNADTYPGRTEKMMELARKRLGDKIVLYADANGSYDAIKAIQVGKMLESLRVAMFEEPCPWEERGETKKVADALAMPISAGEQDSSLWLFQWMIDNRMMDIVQPDLNYCGGFVRAARVARMARQAKMNITPHNTQTGAAAVNILQFASAIPNPGPYIEYPHRGRTKTESWYRPNPVIENGAVKVPTGPGLGLEIDPEYLKKAEIVKRS